MVGIGVVVARVAAVVAATGPPVAVMGVWRDAVLGHPVLAGVLIGAYEILVIVLVFAGKIVADLRERWHPQIVDRLDRILRRQDSRFHQRYREFMLGGLRFIDLKGLATIGFYTPELDEVFVDVSLDPREPNQASGSLLATRPTEVTERRSLEDFLDHPQPVVLAVIGAPGSGKTTLLRHNARQVCRARRGRRRTVPILLYLRDLVSTIASTPGVALPELARSTLGRHGPAEPAGWFEQRLHGGECIVLLDGLDEVGQSADRRGVASWVERQITQYPNNDYVITSRPQGYRSARIDGAAVLQVRSFTDDQVTRFIQGWYHAVERHSTGVTGRDVLLRAEAAADDLLRRLDGAPGLYDLTANPLLLTMIAIVHRHCGALPGSRVDLYGQICQAMLWRRQEAKNLPIAPAGEKKETVLGGLAFAMMRQQLRDLPRAEVLTKIRPALRRLPQKVTAEEFLTDVTSNGLLIERESGLYSFAHLTFQEYLAATHIRDKKLVDVLVDAVNDVWWRETTLLYTARSDADPIVQACLDSTSVTALSLAFDCAEQDSELAPELRGSLNNLLASQFAPDTDPERRRLVAGVLLTRHLRQFIRTGNGGRVCARPITTDLYQLYQQDTQSPPPDSPRHTESGTQQPITGVRGSDAVRFLNWVNGITDSDTVYRLPTFAEVNDPALQRAVPPPTPGLPPHSVWLESDHEHTPPELWTPPGSDHPHLIGTATLTTQITTDIKRSTPTLTRLLLIRSIITIRVFDSTHAIHIDIDRDLYRPLARARTLDHALDRALDLNLDRALYRALYRDLDRDLYLAPTLARTLYLDLERDRALYLELDMELARALDRTLDSIHVLDRTRTLDRDRTLDRALEGLRARVMGRALAGALSRALRRNASASTWPAEFARKFVDEAGIAKADYVVPPDSLADKVNSGLHALVNLLGSPDSTASVPWAQQVARNLQETALPVFTRQHPFTADTATAIRLAALCLAVEADTRGADHLGDTFREIAAGVTLLERRANGQAIPTETIMLTIT